MKSERARGEGWGWGGGGLGVGGGGSWTIYTLPPSSSRLLRLDGASAEVWQLATRATRPALGARAIRSAKEKVGGLEASG